MHATHQASATAIDPRIAIEDMTFAELEHLRGNLGLSRERLCAKAVISPSTYKRWLYFLQGDTSRGSCPRPLSLKAVREVLQVEAARAQRVARAA